GLKSPALECARPVAAAATTYFLLNTIMVATAVALTTGERVRIVWQHNFLWSAPSYVAGTVLASIVAWFVTRGDYLAAPLTFLPAYLKYRTYKVYMARIDDQQRRVQQTSDLHLATLEALARAIDAKDQTTHMHIQRVQLYATGLARARGVSEADIQG